MHEIDSECMAFGSACEARPNDLRMVAVGLICYHGQFVRGRYQGESWLLDRVDRQYYPEDCPSGFQKYRPATAQGDWIWKDAQCKPCGLGRYIVSESLEGNIDPECQVRLMFCVRFVTLLPLFAPKAYIYATTAVSSWGGLRVRRGCR